MKINQYTKPLSFTFDPTYLTNEIKQMQGMAKDVVILSVGAKASFLLVASASGMVAAKKILVKDVQGTGNVPIDSDILFPVLKARKTDLKISFDGSKATVTAVRGNLNAALNVAPVSPDRIDAINKQLAQAIGAASSQELDASQQALIWDTVAQASITDEMHGKVLNRRLDLTGGTLTVTSHGDLHMARTRTKNIKAPDFKLGLSDEYVHYLRKLLGEVVEGGLKLSMTPHYFLAQSDTALLYMPPLQVQEADWGVVDQFLKQKFAFVTTLECGAGRLASAVEALCAVYEQSAALECKATKKGLEMTMTSTYGTVSDLMPCEEIEGTAAFSVEPRTLLNILSLIPPGDKITVKVCPGTAYRIDCPATASSYLGSMHG